MATRKAIVVFKSIGDLTEEVEVVVPDAPPNKDDESAIYGACLKAKSAGKACPRAEFFLENVWARTITWNDKVEILAPCPGEDKCQLVLQGRGLAECHECKAKKS